jgi:hypothetical protein
MEKRGKNDEECDNSCKIKPTVISYFPWDGVMRIKRMAQQLLLRLFQLSQDASTRIVLTVIPTMMKGGWWTIAGNGI